MNSLLPGADISLNLLCIVSDNSISNCTLGFDDTSESDPGNGIKWKCSMQTTMTIAKKSNQMEMEMEYLTIQ